MAAAAALVMVHCERVAKDIAIRFLGRCLSVLLA
jgi:hypothetical protein